jgi:IS5 family transposase
MKTGRYLHAKQKRRARLRRLIRDVRRKMERVPALSERTVKRLDSALGRAWHIAHQKRGDSGYVYSWHAPEVEYISKGEASAARQSL